MIKKLPLLLSSAFVLLSVQTAAAEATAEGAEIEDLKQKIANVKEDITTNLNASAKQSDIVDLQTQIDTIELTPGPQGEQGPAGDYGLDGKCELSACINDLSTLTCGTADQDGLLLPDTATEVTVQCVSPRAFCPCESADDGNNFYGRTLSDIAALDYGVSNHAHYINRSETPEGRGGYGVMIQHAAEINTTTPAPAYLPQARWSLFVDDWSEFTGGNYGPYSCFTVVSERSLDPNGIDYTQEQNRIELTEAQYDGCVDRVREIAAEYALPKTGNNHQD